LINDIIKNKISSVPYKDFLDMASSSEVTLGYWSIRGRTGAIRHLLVYCGIPFKSKLYSDFGEWFGKDKQELGLEYPNLPYLIDGDKKITESIAILHYIPIRASKKELLGDTDDKFIKMEQAIGVTIEAGHDMVKVLMGSKKENFYAALEDACTKGALKNKLELWNKNLEGKEWLVGSLSIADFGLIEFLDMLGQMDPKRLEPYPNLTSIQKRFAELPEIKAHRQSENFIKLWFVPGMYAWYNAEDK
jgi:glutathione S-transferase